MAEHTDPNNSLEVNIKAPDLNLKEIKTFKKKNL